MTKYLISFPGDAMPVTELAAAARDSHAVVREAQAAGVWVFGGGLDSSVAPVRVDAAGTVVTGGYPQTEHLDGGWAVLDLPSREAALEWAAKLAAACRCAQEVRVFHDDPES